MRSMTDPLLQIVVVDDDGLIYSGEGGAMYMSARSMDTDITTQMNPAPSS
jgi:hypothetical protein